MTIGVLGAGAMGSLLAGRLALAGEPVVLLARPSAHVAAIQRDGLSLVGLDGQTERFSLRVVVEPENVATGLAAVVVLVKRWATREALARFGRAIGPRCFVLTLQNGLDADDDVLAALPGHAESLVGAGVTAQGAMLAEPGTVRHTGFGETSIGVGNGTDEDAAQNLAATLSRGGWQSRLEPDIDDAVWRKLAANAAINGLTALTGLPNGAVAELEGLRRLAGRIAREVETVARAIGIDLVGTEAEILAVARATATNRSSMLRDIECGRPTEVDAIHGAIRRVAQHRGIDVPTIETLALTIAAREHANILNGGWAG